jgi:dihydroorotase
VRLIIRNGRVLDPLTGSDRPADILLEDGRILAVGPGLEAGDAPAFDASGLIVAPGFIDLHVHLREPGQEHKETIESGTRAAARGGFTTICAMPNTSPANDRPEITTFIRERAARIGLVRVLPIAAVSKGLAGSELTDMAALAEAGAAAFSDDGRCVRDSGLMRRALEWARGLGRPVIDHCEDHALTGGAVMNEGPASRRLGLTGWPAAAEDIMIARDIILAEMLDASVHIAHLSTAGGVRLIREAKARGVRVTAEATPHHLLLTDEALSGGDSRFKMNPPLRSAADVEALVAGVADGTVDALATDHAPHAAAEKGAGLLRAPFGIVGLETAVSVLLDRLVRPGLLPLLRFIGLWTAGPARILGRPDLGRLAPGAASDLTFLDLDKELVVDSAAFLSKGRNTPFDGWALRGAPVKTVFGGRLIPA